MTTPGPLDADRIPDCSQLEAFNKAYLAAKIARVPFVCIRRHGRSRWTAKTDTWTTPSWDVPDTAKDLLRTVIIGLFRDQVVTGGSTVGPDYIILNGLKTPEQARQLAAAVHAALYGDLTALKSYEKTPAGGVENL